MIMLILVCAIRFKFKLKVKAYCARLAQSVEHETLNLRVVGSSPTLGAHYFCWNFIKAAFLTAKGINNRKN